MSCSAADFEKLLPDQGSCLTEAIAPEKVGRCLLYQAAVLTSNFPFICKRSVSKVTSENRANNTGVVRAMALWDHCLWVSTPKCALTSCKVTSMAHLLTKSVTISRAKRLIGAQQSRRVEFAFRITQKHPADRQGRFSRVRPQGRTGSQKHCFLAEAVPLREHYLLPGGSR